MYWNDAFEAVEEVCEDGGVRIFMYGDTSGGMRDEDHDQSLVERGFLNGLLKVFGDVEKLTASVGGKADSLHRVFSVLAVIELFGSCP